MANKPKQKDVQRDPAAMAELDQRSNSPPLVVKLLKDVPLGNGDRKAGAILATVHLAAGVEKNEIFQAFRNPDILELVER